jgi:NADH dehydrogenase
VLLGEVVHIDVGAREVVLETIGERTRVPYDSLIVAAGAAQSYFGHDDFAVDAPGMRTIDDALELRVESSGRSRWRSWNPTPPSGRRG